MTTIASEAIEAFTALADLTRSRIIELLAIQDRCVCHLIDDLELGQSIISHHVGILRRSGLITSYPHPRDRRWMYYRLDRSRIAQLGDSLLSLSSPDGYNPDRIPCPIDLVDDSE
ncbi:MAG: metalloregulator ArsR/SmtB family transcription factor [Thermomicrobiales bacterium]